MQDQILDMLLKEDEITWQNILYDLIKSEQMDPWDVDISLLSNKYLETLRKMQKMNFFVSGKIILAASMLLKIKSKKLLTDHIEQFDSFLFQSEEPEEFEEFIVKSGIMHSLRSEGDLFVSAFLIPKVEE